MLFIYYFSPLIITYGSDYLLVKSSILQIMIFVDSILLHFMYITWIYFWIWSTSMICLPLHPLKLSCSLFLMCVYFIVPLLKREDLIGSVCHHPFGGTPLGHNLKSNFLMDIKSPYGQSLLNSVVEWLLQGLILVNCRAGTWTHDCCLQIRSLPTPICCVYPFVKLKFYP